MPFTNFFDYIAGLGKTDIFQILGDLNTNIGNLGAKIGLDQMISFIIATGIAVLLGLFFYKLIKLTSALCMGYFGYLVGLEAFVLLQEAVTGLPDWVSYICGGLIAIVFFVLSMARFSYAVYSVFAFLGYTVCLLYTGNQMLSLGAGFLLAFVTVLLLKPVFIVVSSVVCGTIGVSFLSHALPDVAVLQIDEKHWIAWAIVGGVAALFILIQALINRRDTV